MSETQWAHITMWKPKSPMEMLRNNVTILSTYFTHLENGDFFYISYHEKEI